MYNQFIQYKLKPNLPTQYLSEGLKKNVSIKIILLLWFLNGQLALALTDITILIIAAVIVLKRFIQIWIKITDLMWRWNLFR